MKPSLLNSSSLIYLLIGNSVEAMEKPSNPPNLKGLYLQIAMILNHFHIKWVQLLEFHLHDGHKIRK